jgi:hypothetical protein
MPSNTSCLAIANMLGTGVQLNGDSLDPAHGPVAEAAVPVMSRGRLVVVEKSRLAAAGGAAYAGQWMAPDSDDRVKYVLGVQDGFKLETGDKL